MAEKKDLDKELGFEPISDEELGFEPGPSILDTEVSTPEALLKGAQQGLTFGFGDELSGLQGAAMEGVAFPSEQDESKLDQLQRVYKEYRDVARKGYKQAEEQHPTASMIGNLAGGALIPGGVLAQEAKLAQKVAKGAKLGLTGGALAGAGTAETLEETPMQTAKGAGIGLAAGVGLPLAGASVSKVGKAVKELPAIQDLLDAYKYHVKGANLRGPIAPVLEEAQQLGREMEDVVYKAYGAKASQKSSNLEKANDKIISIKDKLESLKSKVKDLPSDSEDEKLIKKKLQSMVDEKLNGIKEIESITKEVPIAGSERAVLEKAELERAKDTVKRAAMDEEKLAESTDPEIAKMIKAGLSNEEISQKMQGKIKTEVLPTEFPNLQAGVISREMPSGEVFPLSSSPIRLSSNLPQTKTVTEKIIQQGEPKTEMSPKELDKFIREFSEYTPINQPMTKAKDATRLALDAKKEFESLLGESVPEYKADNKELSEVMSLYETMVGKSIHNIDSLAEREQINKKLGDMVKNNTINPDTKLKLDKFLSKGIQKSSDPTDVSEAISTYDYKKSQEFGEKAKDIGRRYELMSKLDKEVQTASPEKAALGGGIQSAIGRGATHVGDIVRETKDLGRKSADFIMSSDKIGPIAQKVVNSSKPAAKELYNILQRAASEGNSRRQKALLFGVMQNPAYREIINEVEQEEENEPTE